MLRSLFTDAAVAVAKSHGHAHVEARHVWYAVARHFRDRPGLAPLMQAARRALDPAGTHLAPPAVSAAAEAALDRCVNEAEALAALQAEVHAAADGSAQETAPTAVETAPARSPTGAPPPSTPVPPRESLQDVLAELDALIGLAPVKEQLRRVLAVVEANEQRSRAGLSTVTAGLHLVFTGPPGTGKTTVARLVARLYAAMGALPGAKFTEAGRADLVAGYVGQTAAKTEAVVTRTRPGVLFIDEAYTLTAQGDHDFGAESVASLLVAMETHRSELAVIVAGYRREMAEFVASNPGLKSRFKTLIEFPHYTPEELLEIFARLAAQHEIRLGAGVRERALDLFRAASTQEEFGNARFVRSLFEEAYARMSVRAAADGVMEVQELEEIAVEDLEGPLSTGESAARRIGFSPG